MYKLHTEVSGHRKVIAIFLHILCCIYFVLVICIWCSGNEMMVEDCTDMRVDDKRETSHC